VKTVLLLLRVGETILLPGQTRLTLGCGNDRFADGKYRKTRAIDVSKMRSGVLEMDLAPGTWFIYHLGFTVSCRVLLDNEEGGNP
jgi:hypothetical protein